MSVFEKLEVVDNNSKFETKLELLQTICDGKDVLHIGCCDSPITRDKIINNEFLHGLLQSKAKNIVGLDLSEDGLRIMKEFGFDNLIHGDASVLLNHSYPFKSFDIIVAGDILEHMSNVAGFLESAKSILSPNGKIVVTVPNAFYFYRFIKVVFGVEVVHKDHVYYFSPKVIINLFRRHGYRVEGLFFFKNTKAAFLEKLLDLLFFRKFKYYSHSFGVVISHGDEFSNRLTVID